MPKSLAELRVDRAAGSLKSRPERAITLCLKPDLVARVQSLTAEMDNLPAVKRPRKMVQTEAESIATDPRAVEIREELEALLVEITEHEGEMVLRANLTDGEWRRFVDENPARAEDEPGHERDQRAGGIVAADALIEKLGDFVHAWNSEPIGADDWADIFEPVVGNGDKLEMAKHVVIMYEGRMDFPQWRSALSDGLRTLRDFASPETSESPRSDSTDGSPALSSEATTKTAGKSRSPKPGK